MKNEFQQSLNEIQMIRHEMKSGFRLQNFSNINANTNQNHNQNFSQNPQVQSQQEDVNNTNNNDKIEINPQVNEETQKIPENTTLSYGSIFRNTYKGSPPSNLPFEAPMVQEIDWYSIKLPNQGRPNPKESPFSGKYDVSPIKELFQDESLQTEKMTGGSDFLYKNVLEKNYAQVLEKEKTKK